MEETNTITRPGLRIVAESHFNQGVENWTKEGDSRPLIYSPTEGNPGGCLKLIDDAIGRTNYFVAPLAFLGNKLGTTGLTYDIRWAHQPPLGYNLTKVDLVILARENTVLKYFTQTPPLERSWVRTEILFTPAEGWVNTSLDRPATKEDFRYVLTRLDALKIRAEYYHGGEINHLDNVVMYVVKTPPTLSPLPE